jgi:PAS domain S-box-containing protein
MPRLMVDSTKIGAFVQSSPHPAWLATSRGHCTYANPALERLTGLKSDQIVREAWQNLLVEEDRAAATNSWQRSVASGTPYRTRVRVRGFDGSPATVELIALGHPVDGASQLWLFTALYIHSAAQQHPPLEPQLQATLNLIQAYTCGLPVRRVGSHSYVSGDANISGFLRTTLFDLASIWEMHGIPISRCSILMTMRRHAGYGQLVYELEMPAR